MAQRKKTDGWNEELPLLTEQQNAYVLARVSGLSMVDSYRKAYPKSLDWKKESQWNNASRTERHPKVAMWLSVAQANGQVEIGETLSEHVGELRRLQNICEETGNLGAAVQARQLIGKALGHYTDRVQVTVSDEEALGVLEGMGEAGIALADDIRSRLTH